MTTILFNADNPKEVNLTSKGVELVMDNDLTLLITATDSCVCLELATLFARQASLVGTTEIARAGSLLAEASQVMTKYALSIISDLQESTNPQREETN